MKTPPKSPQPGDDDPAGAPNHDEAPTESSEPESESEFEFRVSSAVPHLRWSDSTMLVRVHDAPLVSASRFRVDFVMRED